jgi:uncharacterized glyoxalase superfamily protein PhnB
MRRYGAIAQLGERLDRTQEVSGSSPLSSIAGKACRCEVFKDLDKRLAHDGASIRQQAGCWQPLWVLGCRFDSMRPNRSIPSAVVIPVLIYPDVREAVAWLSEAFGFVERVRIGEHHRSQLSVGEGAVIVGDVRNERRPPRPGEVTHSVMVRVDHAVAHCERAKSHGARIVMEPTDFEYGERQYTAEDPAGHQWTFSETLDDIAPEAWGGILLTPA